MSKTKETMTVRVRDCLFGIQLNAIMELIALDILQPIVCKKTAYIKNNHRDSVNGYFRIAGTNLVWMHVQDGYGVIINETLQSKQSQKYLSLLEVRRG